MADARRCCPPPPDSGSEQPDHRPAGARRERSRWTLDPATASPTDASVTKPPPGFALAPAARPERAPSVFRAEASLHGQAPTRMTAGSRVRLVGPFSLRT